MQLILPVHSLLHGALFALERADFLVLWVKNLICLLCFLLSINLV